VPGAQIQQAVILLTLGYGYHLFGRVFEDVSETFFEISFFGDPALICKANHFDFNFALLKL